MRVTLGEGERERVVRKYMQEMGEQWKGASVGFDYAIARGQRSVVEGREELGEAEGEGGDAEMASWIWRNLFAARGAPVGVPSMTEGPDVKDLKLAGQLAKVVAFVRREMYRLDQLTDEQVMSGEVGEFGVVDRVEGGL
jgi:cytochrome b pre-mRNA-processing protein 3